MCLKTSYRGRNNPKTDITVYKVLIHLDDGRILAPFNRYEYKLDEVLVDDAKEEVKNKGAAKLISSGYFHSCTTLDSARALIANQLQKVKKEKIFIHKGIVPARTKYYTDNKGNICAKSIKIMSEICS